MFSLEKLAFRGIIICWLQTNHRSDHKLHIIIKLLHYISNTKPNHKLGSMTNYKHNPNLIKCKVTICIIKPLNIKDLSILARSVHLKWCHHRWCSTSTTGTTSDILRPSFQPNLVQLVHHMWHPRPHWRDMLGASIHQIHHLLHYPRLWYVLNHWVHQLHISVCLYLYRPQKFDGWAFVIPKCFRKTLGAVFKRYLANQGSRAKL